MDILLWIILGGIAGWIASMIMGTNARMGAVENVIVGIVGALVGGFIMRAVAGPGADPEGINIANLLVAILGAVVILLLWRAVRRTA